MLPATLPRDVAANRLALLPSLRALSPRSAVTVQLSREQRVNERITSVYGLFDPHIPEGSVLPGARNVPLDTGGHFRILAHPDTISTVLAEAAAPAPLPPAPLPPEHVPPAPLPAAAPKVDPAS